MKTEPTDPPFSALSESQQLAALGVSPELLSRRCEFSASAILLKIEAQRLARVRSAFALAARKLLSK